jgi:hypothetical protein
MLAGPRPPRQARTGAVATQRTHYELGVNARLDRLRVAAAFDELAAAV